MSTTPTVYAICDANCRFETLTREQIYAAITQAVTEGKISNIDTGFITTVKTINGTPLKFFVGTQADYEALTDKQKENLFAIITNDTTKEGILSAITTLQEDLKSLANRVTEHEKHKCSLITSIAMTKGSADLPNSVYTTLYNTICVVTLELDASIISGILVIKSGKVPTTTFGSGYLKIGARVTSTAKIVTVTDDTGEDVDYTGTVTLYKIGTI